MEILWLVLCATTALVNGHPVQLEYTAPDFAAARSEPSETPGHADDAFQFAYAVASPEHGTYHGHQATRNQQGHTSGSYYSLGSDGHWRQTVYADKGQGFQALSNQRPADSPPPQVSATNYQVFVHPGATAISASGSGAPTDLSFFGVKGVGQAPALRGNTIFFNPFNDDSDEDDSDYDDSDEDDDDSLSLESDADDSDYDDDDDDIFRQNFRFNLRPVDNDNDDNDNDDGTENVSLNNEDDENEDDDDDENTSTFPQQQSTLRSAFPLASTAAQGFINQNVNPTATPGRLPIQSFAKPTAINRPTVFATRNQIPGSVSAQSPFTTNRITSSSKTQVNIPDQRFVNRIPTNIPTTGFRNVAPLRTPTQLRQTPTPATRANTRPASALRQNIVVTPSRTNNVQTPIQTPAAIQSSVVRNPAQTSTPTHSSVVQTPATFRNPTVQTSTAIQSPLVQAPASLRVPVVQTQAAIRASPVQNPTPVSALSLTSSPTSPSRSAPVFPFAIIPTSAISNNVQQQRTQNLIQSAVSGNTQNFPQQQLNAQFPTPTQSLFAARSPFNPTNLRTQSPSQANLAATARPSSSNNGRPFGIINRPNDVPQTGTIGIGSNAFVPAQNFENRRQPFAATALNNNNFAPRPIQPTSQTGVNIGSGNQQRSSLISTVSGLSSNASPQRNNNIIITNTPRENAGFAQITQNTSPIQSTNRSGVASGARGTGVPLPLLNN